MVEEKRKRGERISLEGSRELGSNEQKRSGTSSSTPEIEAERERGRASSEAEKLTPTRFSSFLNSHHTIYLEAEQVRFSRRNVRGRQIQLEVSVCDASLLRWSCELFQAPR